MRALVCNNWGEETMFIGVGTDERCVLEWFFLKGLDHPDPITHEELIDEYNIAPYSVQIKYNLIKIPHLI